MMLQWESTNWNTLWSSLIAQVLADHGILTYFVSPGYRNAPFIAALRRREDVDLVSCLDERAAAYQALGFARATERPGVLLSTSGTAAANYLPAVIEASKDQIPLLIITSDRPFELQFTSANQTMKQHGLFGLFVKKDLNFPEPGPGIKPQVIFDGIELLCRSMATFPWGSCHLNLPFRAPLEPVAVPESEKSVFEAYYQQALLCQKRRGRKSIYQRRPLSSPELSDHHCETLAKSRTPLLLLGRLNHQLDINRLRHCLSVLDLPYYCDVTSSLKGINVEKEIGDPSIPAVRKWLLAYQPDLVIHLGHRLVTKHFDEFFADHPPGELWSVSTTEDWLDPSHIGATHFQLEPGPLLELITPKLPALSEKQLNSWLALATGSQAETLSHRNADTNTARGDDRQVTWPELAQGLLHALPAKVSLMIGNSRAIRVFDQHKDAGFVQRRVFANRGVSGIEGLLATSLGIARGSRQPLCLVLGDISLIHDLNSLLALQAAPQPVMVIVVNDGGGSIFRALPIAQYPDITEPLMTTPHNFHFAGIAEMAGLPYQRIRRSVEWQVFCHDLTDGFASALVEIDLTVS